MPATFGNAAPTRVTATSASLTDDRLPGRPTPRFVYAHFPANWEFVDGEYVPRVTRIPLVPGVNGCRKGANGHVPVLSSLRADGWIVIDEDSTVIVTDDDGDLTKREGYLYKWEGRQGPIYADAWSTPTLLGAGRTAVVDWSSLYDRAGFLAWRKYLRDTGVIPAPTPAAMEQAIRIQSRRANRRQADAHEGNPHVKKHVETQRAKLAEMETVRDKANTPKRRPGRPKKVRNDGE